MRSTLREGARTIYTRYLRKRLQHAVNANGLLPTLTREDLLEDSLACLAGIWIVGEEESIVLDTPLYVGTLPDRLQETAREWHFDSPFVIELVDFDLIGPHALPVSPSNALLLENTEGSSNRLIDELVRTIGSGVVPISRRGKIDYDRIVSLVGPWCTEFYHWFADYLPRMSRLSIYEEETGHRPPVLLPADPPSWMVESLDLLNVAENRRRWWRGGRAHVERLVVPSLPHQTSNEHGYISSPSAIRWTAESLGRNVDSSEGPDVGSRLYVSREDQSSRHVRNESDLRPLLDAYGFDVVKPEQWSLREQIAAFREAEAVCGPHGAGLVNVMHAKNTCLVELFGERTNPCFFDLASGQGHRYAAMQATPIGDHLSVDPERLEELLSLALS